VLIFQNLWTSKPNSRRRTNLMTTQSSKWEVLLVHSLQFCWFGFLVDMLTTRETSHTKWIMAGMEEDKKK
jgi:hypothetical protein